MHSTPTTGIVTIFLCWFSRKFQKRKPSRLDLVLAVTENCVDFRTKKDYRYWACHIIPPAGWRNVWIKHSLVSHSRSAFPGIIEMTCGNRVGMRGKVLHYARRKVCLTVNTNFSIMLMVYINRLISMQYLTVTAVTFCVSFNFLITQGLLQLANSDMSAAINTANLSKFHHLLQQCFLSVHSPALILHG